MKITRKKEDFIIYINKYEIDNKCLNKGLENYIKDIILKLKRTRIKDMSGSYKTKVYYNKIYGFIINMFHDKDIEYFPDIIDVNIKIYNDSELYYKTKDIFLIKDKKYEEKNKEYIVNIKDLNEKELIKLIEHGEITNIV